MSQYVHVHVVAEDLQIGDLVQGRGRLVSDIVDHDTMTGFVVAVFERRDVERLVILPASMPMKVRIQDADR